VLFGCYYIYIYIHDSTGSRNDVISIIFLEGENLSFDANFVTYINSNNIPSIIIINGIYDNHNRWYIVPLDKHTITVYINNVIPIASEFLTCVNINPLKPNNLKRSRGVRLLKIKISSNKSQQAALRGEI
jgi:hypothetical protein